MRSKLYNFALISMNISHFQAVLYNNAASTIKLSRVKSFFLTNPDSYVVKLGILHAFPPATTSNSYSYDGFIQI